MSRNAYQGIEKNTARELETMRKAQDGKLIITDYQQRSCAFLISGGRLVSGAVILSDDINPGDIVIAIIKDVKKDIGAAFIEYSEGKDGYLPLELTISPETLKQGDLVPVSIKARAQKGKRAKFTSLIDYGKYENGDELKERANHLSKFNYLYKSDSYITDTIANICDAGEFEEIITDKHEVYEQLSALYQNVRLYQDESFSLSKLYSIETAVSDCLSRQVYLKCGGYLIFDHTEAMTVIDVNSGKYSPPKKTDRESAYFNVNKEAAVEICRQLRARNISGIIIVDFINIQSREKREEIIGILRKESSSDIQPVTIVDFTGLGLAEITRKKSLPSLYEQLKAAR